VNGLVIMYADRETDSMKKAISETNRRRQIQFEYNQKNGITPQSIQKSKAKAITEFYDFSDLVAEKYQVNVKDVKELRKKIADLRKLMKQYSKDLAFEKAAEIRDEIKKLEMFDLKAEDSALEEVIE
jgi:excinuclease ABC subunit B